MTVCWHCEGTGRCKCPFCSPGYEIFEGNMRVAEGDCITPFHGKWKVKVDAGPVVRVFTENELKQIEVWAVERHKTYAFKKDRKYDESRSSLDVHRLGIKSEFAVWGETGGEWLRYHPGGIGAPWDIVGGALRIEVKGTDHPNGRFLPPAHRQDFVADVGYLVVDGPGDEVRIVGSFTAADWEAHKELRDFKQGQGMQWCLNQRWMGDPRKFFKQGGAHTPPMLANGREG